MNENDEHNPFNDKQDGDDASPEAADWTESFPIQAQSPVTTVTHGSGGATQSKDTKDTTGDLEISTENGDGNQVDTRDGDGDESTVPVVKNEDG